MGFDGPKGPLVVINFARVDGDLEGGWGVINFAKVDGWKLGRGINFAKVDR